MKPAIIWTTEADGDKVRVLVTATAVYSPEQARQLAASLLLTAESVDPYPRHDDTDEGGLAS